MRLQYSYELKRQPIPVAIYHVLRDEGIRGAGRGLPPRLIWSTPLAAATFTYYQVLKKATSGDAPIPADGDAVSSAAGADGASAARSETTPRPGVGGGGGLSRDQLR